MTTRLLIFARAPVPGQVKTRLIKTLGSEGAARLAHRMFEHTVSAARDSALDPIELHVTPDVRHSTFVSAAARYGLTIHQQVPGDLGTRMCTALSRSLHGVSSALLVGTDCPGLDAQVLRTAALLLMGTDLVFVPAFDGGYVLVGARASVGSQLEHVFSDIPWGGPEVMERTRTRILEAGLHWEELPALADIDDPDDLRWVPHAWLAP